jgi:hypothetical protein
MIVHSDSDAGVLLSAFLALAVFVALSISVVFALNRQFRSPLRVAGWTIAGAAGWRLFSAIPAADGEEAWRVALDPRQTVNTTLSFMAPSDVHQLFLVSAPRTAAPTRKKRAPALAPIAGFWFCLASPGNDESPFHKRTLLRVL